MHWATETESQLQEIGGTESLMEKFWAVEEERNTEENERQWADYYGDASDYHKGD